MMVACRSAMTARVIAFAVLVCAVFSSQPASAALTDSEKAIVRTFVEKGVPGTAARVRSLVARPDLTAREVAEPLKAAFAAIPFDGAHERFAEALLFGPGSSAARNTLAPAMVESLLARAAARMPDLPLQARTDDRGRDATEEIIRIHSFIDARIANAGNPPEDGHDPSTGIRDDAERACWLLYQDHLAAFGRWFGAPGRASPELLRVRTQVEVTAIDLGRGIVERPELAERMALTGARRAAFERHGVLVEADDLSQQNAIAAAVRALDRVPHATDGLSAWLLSKVAPSGLSARGRVVRAGVFLGDATHPLSGDALWSPDVKPSSPDENEAATAWSVAMLGTERAISSDPVLKRAALRASEDVRRAGPGSFLAVEVPKMSLDGVSAGVPATPVLVVGSALRLLLVDGQRTVDLALILAANGHPEALEQLGVALAVAAGGGSTAALGRTTDDGAIEPVEATDVKTDQGSVTAFALSGKHYAIVADADGTLTASVNGVTPKLTSLANFRERTTPDGPWSAGGVVYDRLFGEPHAAGLDDGRLVLDGGRGEFDAVATGAAASDVDVSVLLAPQGTGGGLLVRANAGDVGYSGVGLILDAAQARLLVFDGHGKAFQLADPEPLPVATGEGYAVSLKVSGDRVVAKVGDQTLTGKLVNAIGPGRVAFTARAEGRLDIRRLKVLVKAAP